MKNIKQRMADFLLENANPSIRYRVLTEVLHENTPPDERDRMQAEVLGEPIIKSIIACQKEDGWLGNGFHGPSRNAGQYENQEVGVKYLGEKLIYRDTPVLKNAVAAFGTTDKEYMGYPAEGNDNDRDKYAAYGADIVKAACVARAGYEDLFDISKEIKKSLDSFRRVTEVGSVTDIVKIRKRRPERVNPDGIAYVFNDYEKWPCWYHLDILAHTHSWRSEENTAMLASSFNKLMGAASPGFVPAYCVDAGHPVGCGGAFREGMELCTEADGRRRVRLDLTEYMCRCGLYNLVPKLRQEVDIIRDSIDERGVCRAEYDEAALRGMGTYSGGQLEINWKTAARRAFDVTFRALLILHYGGVL